MEGVKQQSGIDDQQPLTQIGIGFANSLRWLIVSYFLQIFYTAPELSSPHVPIRLRRTNANPHAFTHGGTYICLHP